MNRVRLTGVLCLSAVWLWATPAAAQRTISELFWGRQQKAMPASYESQVFDEPSTAPAEETQPQINVTPESEVANDNCVPRRWPCLSAPLGMFPWSPRTPEPNRFWGPGQPLWGSSWLNRPLLFTPVVGFINGDHIIRGHVDQKTAFLGGYRFGWDYDYYWGMELRFVDAHMGLSDARGVTNPFTDDYFAGDLNLQYYPWGDTRWRPFVSLGMGAQYFHFLDEVRDGHHATLFSFPFGLGVKYKYNDWLALRMDLTDAVAVGNGTLSTMNNICFTGGVEARFGGRRPSYWPWYPSAHMH
jgi:hypothetical protein